MKKIILLLLTTMFVISVASLFTACPEASSKSEPAESGKAAAGMGETAPSITVSGSGRPSSVIVTFTDPTDWGTRDDGTLVNKKDVMLWLFYLQDDDGDKTKEDIIREVGTDTVTPHKTQSVTPKGVIHLRGNGPYDVTMKNMNTQYALFVRIIHPDSTIANKTAPKANEGTEYKRDTAVVRATSGGP